LSVGVLDKCVWKLDESSYYFINSAYSRLRFVEEGTHNSIYKVLWNLKALSSSMTTAWRVLVDRLPTRENLVKRGFILKSSLCVLGGDEEESGSHVFFKCKVAWKVCSKWIGETSVYHWDACSHFNQFILD